MSTYAISLKAAVTTALVRVCTAVGLVFMLSVLALPIIATGYGLVVAIKALSSIVGGGVMAGILFGVLIFLWCVCFSLLLWYGRCNSRTSADRGKIIDAIFSQANWQELRKDYHEVGYDDHLRALFMLRDPMLLYSFGIREALS